MFSHVVRPPSRRGTTWSKVRCCSLPQYWQLQQRGKSFPPNYLHETWRDWLYWDIELEA